MAWKRAACCIGGMIGFVGTGQMADQKAQVDMRGDGLVCDKGVDFPPFHAHARHAGVNLKDGGQAA
jgi:hypothetical protein